MLTYQATLIQSNGENQPVMTTISKKICLVGDFGVGKTSLIRRFVDRQFSDRYLSTVGVKISRKTIEFPAQDLQLLIWDIEGNTRFKAIAPTYLQGAKGAIIVADVTREETLEHLTQHIQQFLTVNPQGAIVVALNKSDLIEADTLTRLLQLHQFAEQPHIVGAYSTSAKTGGQVDEIFQQLAQSIFEM
ncbi:Rab family GTPase [Phormidesmis sp. 146-35]